MKKTAVLITFYSATILAGGILGFALSKSVASLLSGTISSLILIISAGLLFKEKVAGFWIGLATTLLLDGIFFFRFLKTKNFVPAGLLGVLSLLMVLFLITRIQQMKKRTP